MFYSKPIFLKPDPSNKPEAGRTSEQFTEQLKWQKSIQKLGENFFDKISSNQVNSISLKGFKSLSRNPQKQKLLIASWLIQHPGGGGFDRKPFALGHTYIHRTTNKRVYPRTFRKIIDDTHAWLKANFKRLEARYNAQKASRKPQTQSVLDNTKRPRRIKTSFKKAPLYGTNRERLKERTNTVNTFFSQSVNAILDAINSKIDFAGGNYPHHIAIENRINRVLIPLGARVKLTNYVHFSIDFNTPRAWKEVSSDNKRTALYNNLMRQFTVPKSTANTYRPT